MQHNLQNILDELEEAKFVMATFIGETSNIVAISVAADIMIKSIKSGGKIISCGNGGSMSDAMHFASELTGRYRDNRKPLPAIAISDPGHLSCASNDYGYSSVFSRWIMAHGKPDDTLLALSTSGNSENVFLAVQVAQAKGMAVVFLGGNEGGSIIDLLKGGDTSIIVPHHGFADRVQEASIIIIHILVMLIEKGVVYDNH